MGDPLFLSCWLKGFQALGLPVYFEKALECLPFSKLQPGGILRVHAVSLREPPQLERAFGGDPDLKTAAALAREFLHTDCAFSLETHWDLWQWDGDWALKPSRISIEVYAPEFESLRGEHLLIDAGPEGLFLPNPHSGQWRPVQSNIRSVLHLAQDLDAALPVERRLLWSDTEEDFSARLEEYLG